jgi:hypothetical protein
MRRSSLFLFPGLFFFAASFTLTAHCRSSLSDQPLPAAHTLAFTYRVHVPAAKDAQGKMLFWLPLP